MAEKALNYKKWLTYVRRHLVNNNHMSEKKSLVDVEAMYDWNLLYRYNLPAKKAVQVYRGKEVFDGRNQIPYGPHKDFIKQLKESEIKPKNKNTMGRNRKRTNSKWDQLVKIRITEAGNFEGQTFQAVRKPVFEAGHGPDPVGTLYWVQDDKFPRNRVYEDQAVEL